MKNCLKLVKISDTQFDIDFEKFGGRVNSTVWLGRLPGTCMLTKYAIDMKLRNGPYRLTVEVQERKRGWKHVDSTKTFLGADFNQLGLTEEHLVKGHVPTKW